MSVGGPYSTSGDAEVACLAVPAGYQLNQLQILNNGAQGFFSIDGGVTWQTLPASQQAPVDASAITGVNIYIKRIAGGTDLSGVWMVLQTPAPAPTPTGTITGVTAGTGLSGGGTSGNVTLNNTVSPSSPGGASGTLQYNNAGVFGGIPNTSFAAANLAMGGNSLSGVGVVNGAGIAFAAGRSISESSNAIVISAGDSIILSTATTYVADAIVLQGRGFYGNVTIFGGGGSFVGPIAATNALSVTGSKASGAALISLLTQLAAIGLIVNNTTT
jgi:hypothetical protein